MKKCFLQAVNLFLLLGLAACATAPIRDTGDLEVVSARAQAGDKNAIERMLATLAPGKVQSPAIVASTLRRMSPLMSRPEAVQAVRPHLTSPDADIRAAAFSAWMKTRPATNAAAFDRDLTTILFANQNRFGRLSDEEYIAAGYSDDPQAIEFLRRNLGKFPESDPVIIRSLGEIIFRRRQTEPPSLSEGKGGDEDLSAKLAEEALIDYAGSEAEESLRKLAIRTVETSYGAAGYDRLLSRLSDRYTPLPIRMSILNYLANTEQDRMEQRLTAVLPSARLWFNNEPEYQQRIDEVLAQLTGKTEAKNKSAQRKTTRKHLSPTKSILSPENRKQIARKDQRSRILSLFEKYQLSEEELIRMESHARFLVQEQRLRLNPATKLLFHALSKSKPDANFFELKKLAEQGFNVPGYYAGVMKAIINSERTYEWQILAIRRVWGVKEDTAEILHRMYRAERNIF